MHAPGAPPKLVTMQFVPALDRVNAGTYAAAVGDADVGAGD